MHVEGGGEVLTETPAMRGAVVVDHADLIVPKAVDAIFVQKELGVLYQKVADLRFGVVEHKPAGMALVGEIEGVIVPACLGLSIEEIEAFVAEVAAGVVIDHVEEHGETVKMREIYQRLELVHFAAQVFRSITARAFCIEQLIHLG